MIHFAAILFSVLIASHLGYAQMETGSEIKSGGTAFVLNGLPESVGQNRKETTIRLGKPAKVLIEEHANNHLPGVIDSIVCLRFNGASIRYFVPGKGNPSKEFVIEAEITSSRLRLGQGVKFGDKIDTVISALGTPNKLSPDSLVYEDDDMQNKAILYFKSASLAKAKWKFYWD